MFTSVSTGAADSSGGNMSAISSTATVTSATASQLISKLQERVDGGQQQQQQQQMPQRRPSQTGKSGLSTLHYVLTSSGSAAAIGSPEHQAGLVTCKLVICFSQNKKSVLEKKFFFFSSVK
jgi:hypothetical protein